MEVAGQWRREWAGAAEYGKVTEGGVTRQVARAMEVLNASTAGARVRVVRAAYHSSSGPGAPASSYMMHSSRRVISSGTTLLSPSLTSRPFGETPSLPSLPLEISSTPLDLAPDMGETENYRVTEPDDTDISAPSKWKGSTGKNSIRMPSEESSSTDNASIIDLDPRTNHKSIFRKYSYDSEGSDIPSMKPSSRASPLLDAPVTLSTLKYKSLLNGSNDWNNRRKSYSFEETAPLNETISHCNDTLAMESSTDSGICKSSELVNDHSEYERKDRKYDTHEDSFKDWLYKNRQTSFNKINTFKAHREHDVVIEEPSENNIILQSKGKVSITVPISLESEADYQQRKANEDIDRRVKKVEFCKTELHFAAESGKVNIIATDEKPPSTNDFRRKKSAFIPINNKPERPITLFGEQKPFEGGVTMDDLLNYNTSEVNEFDENTAATKSILKNKIPKPKPYLLGENMAFGLPDNNLNTNKSSINKDDSRVSTAVSSINRQLQSEKTYRNDTSSLLNEIDKSALTNFVSRPNDAGLSSSVTEKHKEVNNKFTSTSEITSTYNSAKSKIKAMQTSPIPTRSKTRQLRQSDLTYFGIPKEKKNIADDKPKFIRDRIKMQNDAIDNIFQSVRLIQQVSNSVCNSEAESEEAVEYQNVPFKSNFAPVPTPRSRTKHSDKAQNCEEVTILKPIIEQDINSIKQNSQETRRSRSRKYEDIISPTLRSISEPPKANRLNSAEKTRRRHNHIKQDVATRTDKYDFKDRNVNYNVSHPSDTAKLYLSEEDEDSTPIYVNINKEVIDEKEHHTDEITHYKDVTRKVNDKTEIKGNLYKESNRSQSNSYDKAYRTENCTGGTNEKTNSIKKKKTVYKADNTERLSSDHASSITRKATSQENKSKEDKTSSIKKQDGSLRRGEKNGSDRVVETSKNAYNLKDAKDQEVSKEVPKPQHVRSTSRHSTAKKDSLEQHKRSSTNSSDRHRNSLQIKPGERNGEARHSKDKAKLKRNEYVINYDDKNGTVASICKVSTEPGSTRRKKSSLDRVKDTPKEFKSPNKTTQKINLLQFPDQERNLSRFSHAHKKSKTKAHIQRSCQLL